jgi:GH15 family glucan-1,4-alpha-glucosidase
VYKKISDYGIIGNLHSAALIGLDGSIDWLCMPHLDSPSVFGALLDDKNGGRFSVSPADEWDSTAEYLPDTNILITKFRTKAGIMQLVDFMPVDLSYKEERHELYRCAEILEGNMTVRMVFDPRFNYALTRTTIEKTAHGVMASGEDERIGLSCTSDIGFINNKATAEWHLSKGERVWMHLQYDAERPAPIDAVKSETALRETEAYWRDWLGKSETGRMIDLGPYKNMVERSALILKLLYYHPTGTIAAAATTSLPEGIGGVRNWDYRYTWVRDTSFTLQALFNLGHLSEMEGYFNWIRRLLSEHGAERLQIMYGLHGEEDLPEIELEHLEGYKGSRPVRTGNAAAGQKQLDIYGEIMDAALKLSDYVGKLDYELWPLLCGLCDYVVEHWREKDSGIWEVRGGPYHFVYSKVMCWLALDRGITIAHRYGFPGDLEKWEKTRAEIKQDVLDKGWNEEKKSFVQHYDTDSLDASSLLLPVLGFLPFDDPRIASTVEAVRKELGNGGFLYRYRADDHIPGGEGVFLLCNFWLIDCLTGLGRFDEADRLLRKMEGISNHLGIFSEEYDPEWKEMLGNIPQAFTHIGFINSVITIAQAKAAASEKEKTEGRRPHYTGFEKIVLNSGKPGEAIPPNELVSRLKQCMNFLRGAYFDTPGGRVAYERMSESEMYRHYLELSYSLNAMDLNGLRNREEKTAFWINLYNVIVIHGVIELGVRDSVKEIRNFFSRVRYRIGNFLFSPNDIEHGILRGNRRPPHSLFRRFGKSDPRLSYTLYPVDPRIHFALVCASSSCPPIDVYTAGELNSELDIAGRTFLNAGGIRLDKEENRASLSRIFKWYDRDFGTDMAERLRFIVRFLYDDTNRKYIEENAESIKVDYQKYDWRLNRY